jgi:DNA-binding NtrC family response regulator
MTGARGSGQETARDAPASIGVRRPPDEPHLFVVLECRRPLSGGARASLAGVDQVTLGRGEARTLERAGRAGTLDVRIPDPGISQRHARLVRERGGWVVEDVGSTNGTRLDGERVTRAAVVDGAILELGATLIVLRTALPTPRETPPLLDAERLDRGRAGLATLLPEYTQALATFARVAMSRVPLLLLGESGTGKEVLARAAHSLSGRKGAFVPVNCGALPAALVESQLFGHVKGAFSGALGDQPGLVRSSAGGTLFLDEIGDLPAPAQAALLRVLQEREVTPVGSSSSYAVDLRVVAATHRRIDVQDTTGGFRGDLYARLAGFTHVLPPLRDRKEDLGVLLRDLLPAVAPERAERMQFSTELGRALLAHGWPFNVRELQQALAVATVLATDVIRLAHAPETLRAVAHPRGPSDPPAASALAPEDQALRDAVVTALRAERGNVSEVARAMGKTRMQIHRWMQRFDIDPKRFRS